MIVLLILKKCKEFLAKAKGIKLIPENEDGINSVKLSIATFTRKEDKYLYWHCPLGFVREYLETQCIPYEGNEHLLGKTDDCDEFYKTWK